MYPVRGTRTSRLRASRGPDPHALEHVSPKCVSQLGSCTSVRLSGGQAYSSPSSEVVLSKSRSFSTVENFLTGEGEGEGPTDSHCNLEPDVVQSPVLESQFEAELASREQTIGELQCKLQLSELLACDQALQQAEFSVALKAKDASFNEMVFCLEKANSKDKENVAQIKELKDRLTIANAKEEQKVQAEAELQEVLQTDQQLLILQQERIQELEEQLESFEMQAEARLRQEVARMQQELEESLKVQSEKYHQQNARAEAKLRQDVSELKEHLQGTRDLAKKSQTHQQLSRKLEKEKLHQVTEKLAAKDDEFALLCRTLKEEQKKALSYELSLKLLQEQVDRFSGVRAELEHRNGDLEKEILRLKLEVRRYAEIIVGNEGKPFYEVRLTEDPSVVGSNREEEDEAKASEQVLIPKDESPGGQDSDPGRHTPRGIIFAPNQQPQEHARRG